MPDANPDGAANLPAPGIVPLQPHEAMQPSATLISLTASQWVQRAIALLASRLISSHGPRRSNGEGGGGGAAGSGLGGFGFASRGGGFSGARTTAKGRDV
jgi:hypothetical protein